MVKAMLRGFGLHCCMEEEGIVEIDEDISDELREQLRIELKKLDFALLDKDKAKQIEEIKAIAIDMVYNCIDLKEIKFSDYLQEKLDCNYTYLANCFKEDTGATIQDYINYLKNDKAIEMLIHDDLSSTEIADEMYYCDVSNFDKQFKKFTGFEPTHLKKLKKERQIALKKL